MEELIMGSQSSLLEEQIRDYLEQRIIIFNTGVTTDILEDVILHILKWNKEDKNILPEKRKPIWIYIQSPGGSVISGFNLIDVIEASETPVHTLCFSQCASMGFHIFIAGHKRYAFPNSIFMMHDGEISLTNSTSKAKDTMKFFDSLEARTKSYVIKHTNIDEAFYQEIYDKEYYMYANEEGKEFGCVDYVIGQDITLSEII